MWRDRKTASHNKEHAMNKETCYEKSFDYPELDKMGAEEFYRTYKSFMFSVAQNEKLDHGQAAMFFVQTLVAGTVV